MNKYRHPKSSLLLIEIMINSFFFAILITICVQLFFKAYKLSQNADSLHHALTACTSIAEAYQSNYNGKDTLLEIYPDALALNTSILIYFDEHYLPCTKNTCSYRAVLDYTIPSNANITFYEQKNGTMIYTLTVSSYAPRTLNTIGGTFNENN